MQSKYCDLLGTIENLQVFEQIEPEDDRSVDFIRISLEIGHD